MNRERLRRIRNWQSHEWYAALVVRPIAILVMLVVADWKWLTPNVLTTLANVAKLAAAWLIYTEDMWPAAILLQVGLLFDHLDGTMARYRRAFTQLGSFYDKVSDAITWFPIMLAAGWVAYRHGQGTLMLVLATTSAYALLALGYMKWVADSAKAKQAWFEAKADPAAAVARHTAPPKVSQPPERTAKEWAVFIVTRLAQVVRFEEVDLFFWLGLALVTDRVAWFLWACAVTQVIGVAIMCVVRGREARRADAIVRW